MISKMMHQTFQIKFGGRKVPFDIRDDIFALQGPVEPLRD
jgi:hypothetical protein